MAQFARPDSDVTTTGFTFVGGGSGWVVLDEATANDADRAYGANGGGNTLEVGLSDVTDPVSSSGHVIRFRAAKVNSGTLNATGNAVQVTCGLYQGTTLIASLTTGNLGSSWSAFSFTLTGTEADSITDYADLRLRFTDTANGGSPSGRRGGAVSWAELEVPNAVINTTATPGTASLTTSRFAPSVTATANVRATPGAASLTLTASAPTVTATDPKTATPGTASVTVSGHVPAVVVSNHTTATPGTATLALTGFVLSATASDNRRVTPSAAAMALTAWAPTVTATAGSDVTAIPGAASLAMTGRLPTVAVSDHRTATPTLASLALTAFAPNLVATDHKVATPGAATAALGAFAPIVTTSSEVVSGGPAPRGRARHSIPSVFHK